MCSFIKKDKDLVFRFLSILNMCASEIWRVRVRVVKVVKVDFAIPRRRKNLCTFCEKEEKNSVCRTASRVRNKSHGLTCARIGQRSSTSRNPGFSLSLEGSIHLDISPTVIPTIAGPNGSEERPTNFSRAVNCFPP